MNSNLPDFRSGMRFGDLDANQMNELTRAARLIMDMTVRSGDGLEVNKSRQGIQFGVARTFDTTERIQATKPVVIVEEPTEQSVRLKVREIIFATDSPDAMKLDWHPEPAFEVMPFYHLEPLDYSDFAFTEATLTTDAKIIHVNWLNGIHWMLERPTAAPTGIKFAEVKTASATLPVLMVQPIKQDFENDGILVNDGPIISVFVWPKTNGAIYQHHIPPKSVIVIFKIGGEWYADQTVRWYTRANTPVQLVDC